MLESLVANAGQYIHTNAWLALVAVFLGGIITASNPCVLAMIPLIVTFASVVGLGILLVGYLFNIVM